MGKKVLSTPQIIVNNIVFPIVPNSLVYTEGFGEYNMRGSSVGAGKTEVVFSENSENKISKINFELFPTAENVESIREWKAAQNDNAIEIVDSELQRTFTNAALINDYEVNIGADTTISVEFVSDPAK